MNAVAAVVDTLDSAVTSGHLVGFVCGVRRSGRSEVVAGGRASIGGPALAADAVFPLTSNTKPVGGALAMALVERGVIDTSDPVAEYLPELGALRVLARPDAPLDDTVALRRPVTIHHLLTMTAGFGWVGENPALATAMAERGLAPGPYAPPMDPESFLRRLGELPLAAQPGDGWWYHTSSDVLGALLARATGSTVESLLEEYITGPLGLPDTAFTADTDRMPTSYGADPAGRPEPLAVADRFRQPPVFESLACGLAGTVADYLRFLDVLGGGGPVLGPAVVERMCVDHLTDHQRRAASGFVGQGCGYGLQVEVRPGGIVGWAGGLGTIGYVDRTTGRSAAVFTTQSLELPGTEQSLDQVWRLLAG